MIEAFNKNMPFDRFTIEQLAGDLLPNATLDQKIATGFNRNHPINFEGGAIPEEYQVAYVVDRVNTTATVWMGLTLGCTQCHDHKYDPFTQKEFYQLYAYFNNLPENGIDGTAGNAVPLIKAPNGTATANARRICQPARRNPTTNGRAAKNCLSKIARLGAAVATAKVSSARAAGNVRALPA